MSIDYMMSVSARDTDRPVLSAPLSVGALPAMLVREGANTLHATGS